MPYYRRHLDDREIQQHWLDPRLATVRPGQVRAYLLARGWKEMPAEQPGVLVFQEPPTDQEGPLYQWLPDSPARRDYVQALYELIGALAQIEVRYAGDVLTDILEYPDREPIAANGPAATVKKEPTAP